MMNSLRGLVVAVACLGAAGVAAQTPMSGMGAMDHGSRPKGVASTSLAVSIAGKSVSLRVADLEALPRKTVNVHNAHSNTDETYSGPLLTDVLAKAGAGDAGVGKALLRSYVKAEGTDKYWVLYSGIEIEGASHLGDVIVATMVGGKPLGENGKMMLVSTEDKKPQRWVRNLTSLTLVKVD